jgi:hypothetical protein
VHRAAEAMHETLLRVRQAVRQRIGSPWSCGWASREGRLSGPDGDTGLNAEGEHVVLQRMHNPGGSDPRGAIRPLAACFERRSDDPSNARPPIGHVSSGSAPGSRFQLGGSAVAPLSAVAPRRLATSAPQHRRVSR